MWSIILANIDKIAIGLLIGGAGLIAWWRERKAYDRGKADQVAELNKANIDAVKDFKEIEDKNANLSRDDLEHSLDSKLH